MQYTIKVDVGLRQSVNAAGRYFNFITAPFTNNPIARFLSTDIMYVDR